MVDVRGDVLRPPHGTTPAAVKSWQFENVGVLNENIVCVGVSICQITNIISFSSESLHYILIVHSRDKL